MRSPRRRDLLYGTRGTAKINRKPVFENDPGAERFMGATTIDLFFGNIACESHGLLRHVAMSRGGRRFSGVPKPASVTAEGSQGNDIPAVYRRSDNNNNINNNNYNTEQ